MAGRHRDGPLRTALSADRANSNTKIHTAVRRRIGFLRWMQVCRICGTCHPCWFLRDAQEVLDGGR